MPGSKLEVQDLLALLAERDHQSLPFAVTATSRRVRPADLVQPVRAAIAFANNQAVNRVPDDPTWCTDGDAGAGSVVAEISKGVMLEGEVKAWLTDLMADLDRSAVSVKVGPWRPKRRLPDFSDWISLDPAVTAFTHFTSLVDDGPVTREIPAAVIREIARPLVDWSRLPGGTTEIYRGLTRFASTPARAADELLTGLPTNPLQLTLGQYTLDPKRYWMASLDIGATGRLQVFDSTRDRTLALTDLLAGLRIVAPYLDYASVRPARPIVPNAQSFLGREPTDMESQQGGTLALHLLADFAVDAYVAQVLTTRHLEKAHNLHGFAVEGVGNDRYLVVAQDPAAWLNDLNPAVGVLEAARRAFGSMLLTHEVMQAQRPSWYKQ